MIISSMLNNSNIYYEEILLEWLHKRKESIKESSYLKYHFIINKIILPKLGKIKFKKLSNKDINDFFNSSKLLELADSTKSIILIIIKFSIKYGVDNKYRKEFGKIEIKFKKSKGKIIYFTKKEQQILENYLNSKLNIRNLGILLSLYTGIRIGELCSLKKKDIDFINGTISINRTVQRVCNTDLNQTTKTKLIVQSPKTIHSIRIVPLPDFLLSILEIMTEKINNDEYYIFTNSTKPKDPRSFEKYFANVLKKCNIRNLNFHSLRHTFATRSREAGVDIKVLSEILGHSSYHITQEIYVHISNDFKKDSINSLIHYLNQKNSEEHV